MGITPSWPRWPRSARPERPLLATGNEHQSRGTLSAAWWTGRSRWVPAYTLTLPRVRWTLLATLQRHLGLSRDALTQPHVRWILMATLQPHYELTDAPTLTGTCWLLLARELHSGCLEPPSAARDDALRSGCHLNFLARRSPYRWIFVLTLQHSSHQLVLLAPWIRLALSPTSSAL